MSKTCIIIAGPTAVGKTSIAVALAQHFSTEIISADSRQCYRELGIGVAKPSAEELSSVRHHFINSHSIHDEVNAAGFEDYALRAAESIFSNHNTTVVVGGTGLYIRAFLKGMDPIPPTDPVIRQAIMLQYETRGMSWLQEELSLLDPLFASKGEMKNPQRMMRALEVVMGTGQSILSQQKHQSQPRAFQTIFIGLDLPREILYQRINHRVDQMVENGLVEEARTLYPYRSMNALQTVGYRELFDYFDKQEESRAELSKAIEKIKQNSRHYAKRQLTWFRREEEITWVEPDIDSVLDVIKGKMTG